MFNGYTSFSCITRKLFYERKEQKLMQNQNHMTPRRGRNNKSKRNMCRDSNISLMVLFAINIFSLVTILVGGKYLMRNVPTLITQEERGEVPLIENGGQGSYNITVDYLDESNKDDVLAGISYNLDKMISNNKEILGDSSEPIAEEPTLEEIVEDLPFDEKGYVTANVLNVREEPNTDSEIKDIITYNKPVSYSTINDEWGAVKMEDENNDDSVYFINLKYITDESMPYEFKEVTGDRRKSYLDYKSITLKSSRQYRIQKRYAETDPETGIRTVDGKYCIALGSYFSRNVGQYVDLVLANGEEIPCVVGDAKADLDTNENNSIGKDGSVSEFIIDKEYIDHSVKKSGDISDVNPNWDSEVIGVKLYDKSLLQW